MRIELGNGGMTLLSLAELSNGVLRIAKSEESLLITSVATDSREVSPGTLFLGIRGERVDGNDYAEKALENGASAVLCEHLPEKGAGILVPDTVSALGRIAAHIRKRHAVPTVAVTGSVGKTTTKELLYGVLSAHYSAHASKGNYNSNIGLPMSVLECADDTEAAVYELGMSAPMEIDYLTKLVTPDIGLITNIGTAHMESLGSRENIAKAKLEIVNGMAAGSTLLLSGDEPLLRAAREQIAERGIRTLYVSVEPCEEICGFADLRASNLRSEIGKTVFDLRFGETVLRDLSLNVMGVHTVYAAAFAVGVGLLLGIPEAELRAGLLAFKAAPMRQSIETIGGVTVIEDCYNASPESMRAALDVAESLAEKQGTGRVLALLGDMRELGTGSASMHASVGQYAAKVGVHHLFTFGAESSEFIAKGAAEGGIPEERICRQADPTDAETVAERILASMREGDVLLVKASRALRAERIVAHLKTRTASCG